MKRFFSSIVLSIMMVITFSNPFVYADDLTNTWELDQVLQNYNIFSFGIASGVHIAGPVVAQGDLTHVSHIDEDDNVALNPNTLIGFSQIHGGTSSYIKGKINPSNIEPQDSVLVNNIYLGSINTVVETETNYDVNGNFFLSKGKMNPKKKLIVTDTHLDFDSIQKQFSADSHNALEKAKTNSQHALVNGETLILKEGDAVVMDVEAVNQIKSIKLDFDLTTEIPTLLHIEGTGAVNIPMTLDRSGNQINTGEYGSNNNFAINISEAEKVTMGYPYGAPHFGHIIAPMSDVYSHAGHFAGSVITNNFWSKSEAHFYPSKSPIIPVTPVDPDVPVVPEDPVDPDIPEVPEDPVDPDVPVVPEDPVDPDIPEVPEDPVDPDVPVVPEDPVDPDIPEVPEDPVDPDIPEVPEVPVEPIVSEKTRVPKVRQNGKKEKPDDILPNTGKSRNLGGYVLIGAGIYFYRKNRK
ncbi:choice-of-anchor A family protein [Erysipelothrix rhusiopathiae]|nr:choice-of-anchor A family protein [Erysipelothrix rhusiopathiae]